MTNPKILLGGVPFGCDNVGNEAILVCTVELIRREVPNAEIMACTNAVAETEKLLKIKCTSLYGFDHVNGNKKEFQRALAWADFFVWSGTTGLSDYPEVGMHCLEMAHNSGVATIVFCSGMNETFDPRNFRVGPGPSRTVLSALNTLCAEQIDFIQLWERRKEERIRKRLKVALDKCALVVNRDATSRDVLMKSNLKTAPLVGADPVITLKPERPEAHVLGEEMVDFLQDHERKFGVCISAQQPLRQLRAFSAWLDNQVIQEQAGIVFIPMNPITDLEISKKIRQHMRFKSNVAIAEGLTAPEHVAGLAEEMDLVISSRLHLLILASVTSTPCLGIGRGSKVRVFLKQIGQQTVGTTEDMDFAKLDYFVKDILARPNIYDMASRIGRKAMLGRLNEAMAAFGHTVREIISAEARVSSNAGCGA